MAQTRSQTTYVPTHAIPAGAATLANAVDDTIAQLSAGHDVISVSIVPLATGLSDGESPTAGVLVPVIWREG